MNKFKVLKDKFKAIPDLMGVFINDAFTEFDSVAEDMNISQLNDGKRSDGSMLPNYSRTSVAVYGKPSGPMNLKDTGAFHKSITLKSNKVEAEIIATDSKTEMLKDFYGDDIIGLSEENIESLKNDYIAPSIKENVKKFING